MKDLKLFMVLLGCNSKNRNIEQHDIFFGIGNLIGDLVPDLIDFWPEAGKTLHVDAWRVISNVDGHTIKINTVAPVNNGKRLFFLNCGGYKENEFEEFHYKALIVASNKGEATSAAKKSVFFRHTGFKGANSHIDEKYGIDVDDIFEIKDILPTSIKSKYSIEIDANQRNHSQDKIHLGYFRLDSLIQNNKID